MSKSENSLVESYYKPRESPQQKIKKVKNPKKNVPLGIQELKKVTKNENTVVETKPRYKSNRTSEDYFDLVFGERSETISTTGEVIHEINDEWFPALSSNELDEQHDHYFIDSEKGKEVDEEDIDDMVEVQKHTTIDNTTNETSNENTTNEKTMENTLLSFEIDESPTHEKTVETTLVSFEIDENTTNENTTNENKTMENTIVSFEIDENPTNENKTMETTLVSFEINDENTNNENISLETDNKIIEPINIDFL